MFLLPARSSPERSWAPGLAMTAAPNGKATPLRSHGHTVTAVTADTADTADTAVTAVTVPTLPLRRHPSTRRRVSDDQRAFFTPRR